MKEKYLKWNNSSLLDWTIRILFTLDILPLGLHTFDHYEPGIIVFILIIGVWLYFIKWRILALLALLFLLYFNIMGYVSSSNNYNSNNREVYIDSLSTKSYSVSSK